VATAMSTTRARGNSLWPCDPVFAACTRSG
jgi:hypothetical protein